MPLAHQKLAVTRSDLLAIAQAQYGPGESAWKGEAFFRLYEERFSELRDRPISLLELGVQRGSSIRTWRAYFSRASIVGLDLDPAPLDLPGVHLIKGDQSDVAVLATAIAANGGPFDIIIDDASHIGLASKASFAYLFPLGLKPGGTYVVEDFGAPLLQGWPDGCALVRHDGLQSYQHGTVGFLKQLLDDLAITQDEATPQFAIARMDFYRNIAFITKEDYFAEAGSSIVNARTMTSGE